ncbi:MipA/OmpV family protein [Thalassotalea euphylliae]|uniref:MipA/OmpV family protein n=1 Tax=Thalassotalea euphylliae TaxID=1655234 RepID=UPI003637DAE0
MNIIKRLALLMAIISTSFFTNANETQHQELDNDEESGFHWELDLGVVAFYQQSLIESLAEYDKEIGINVVASGGIYFDNFFAEVAPYSGRPFTFGYTLHKSETRQLNLVAESHFFEISEEEQENGNLLDGINTRESSMEVGVEYFGILKKYDFRLTLLHDALNEHNGTIARADISRPYFTKYVMFVPGISVTYIDENATDYYYGVSPEEATSYRPAYKADSALITTARLYVERPIDEDWSVIAAASYSAFSDAINDSPIVNNRNEAYNISVGVLWTF